MVVGQSRIGGRPDLPPHIGWPTETSLVETTVKSWLFFTRTRRETITRPLSFIAQINLSETVAADTEQLLPPAGILYFFYAAEQDAWGIDPSDKTKFKIIYWNGPLPELVQIPFPENLPDYARYTPCALDVRSEISLPSYGHPVYDDFTEEEDNHFWEQVHPDEPANKLLGYSDNIQNDMELDCELATHGIPAGDAGIYNSPAAKALEHTAPDWRLLLQIDSNELNQMMWGDCGRLYFWIKKEDLQKRDFNQAWFGLQCT